MIDGSVPAGRCDNLAKERSHEVMCVLGVIAHGAHFLQMKIALTCQVSCGSTSPCQAAVASPLPLLGAEGEVCERTRSITCNFCRCLA